MQPPLPPAGDSAPRADEGQSAGWMAGAQTLLLNLLDWLGDGLELLSLEVQRGLRQLERLLWLLLLSCAALMTAWLFFWVGLALVLADAGMAWPLACAVVALANAGVLALCLSYSRLLRPLFALPATRRQLGLWRDAAESAAPPPPPQGDLAAPGGSAPSGGGGAGR